MSLFARIRLLPVLIFVAVLMLSVRVVAVWDDMDTRQATIEVAGSAALAQQANTNAAPTGTLQPPAPNANPSAQPPAPNASPATPSPLQTDLESAKAVADPPSSPEAASLDALINKDSTFFTPSEISLLQRLQERREQLDDQARQLVFHKARLQAAEVQIESKILELKRLETSIQGLLREQDAQERARLDRLVLLYQTMKPAEAANVLNGMDTPLVVDIFLLMRERNAAPILANMDPQKAREVTDALANRRVETGPGEQPQG